MTAREAVFHALRVYGPSKGGEDVVRMISEIRRASADTPALTAPQVTRCLRLLAKQGLVEKRDGTWCVPAKFLRLTEETAVEVDGLLRAKE